MAVRPEEITAVIKEQIQSFGTQVQEVNVGTVVEAGDGIVRIYGLSAAMNSELLEIPRDSGEPLMAIALNLEQDSVSAVILGDYTGVKEGDEVRATGRVIEVPVGDGLLGRVVDGLGQPIDGKGPIPHTRTRAVERIAPGVTMRQAVDTPVQTGIKAIDSMIPIGRGQRELIIGDRSTGKTAVAIDAIINQQGGDLLCIYVAIGQKASKVAQVVGILQEQGALDHTIIVSASAAESAGLQYIAPYTGCAMGEEFMEQGRDALIIYDDLSKHAWAYRQISLLLRRPPGREAYPGDVFYLHSRLLERAARLDQEHGGGSMTALPIIETLAGDVSAYIPTNVISITDGQIYLESDLFNAGIRPAINPGISVSRVGGKAQRRSMRQVAGSLRLDMSQYRELQAFAAFGTSDLDVTTRRQIERGQRTVEVLKQPQYQPLSLPQEVEILFAVSAGQLDDVPVDRVRAFETAFHSYMQSNHPDIAGTILSSNEISDQTREALTAAIQDFKKAGLY